MCQAERMAEVERRDAERASATLGVALLIGVIEKDLKGVVIFATLRIVHRDSLCPGHNVLRWMHVPHASTTTRRQTPAAIEGALLGADAMMSSAAPPC